MPALTRREAWTRIGGPWLDYLFVFAVVFLATPFDLLYTVKPPPDAVARAADVASGDVTRQVGLVLLGSYGLLTLAFRRRSQLRSDGALGLLIIAFTTVALASVLWAEDRDTVVRKLAILGLLWVGAAGLASRYSIREILGFALVESTLTFALSLGAELALGTFQPFSPGYLFAGVGHSNQQGINLAILIISTVALLACGHWRHRSMLWLLLTFAAVFLVLTRSRTAVASAVLALGLLASYVNRPARVVAGVLSLGIVACVLVLVVGTDLGEHLRNAILLGRAHESASGTLTNRLPLWIECLSYVRERPWLGYGYDSFWTPRRILTVSAHQGWAIPHSHNGYLEAVLGLGTVGASLYTAMLAGGILKARALYHRTRNPAYAGAFALLVWFCLNMLLEKVYMSPFFPTYVAFALLAKLGLTDPATRGSVIEEQGSSDHHSSLVEAEAA